MESVAAFLSSLTPERVAAFVALALTVSHAVAHAAVKAADAYAEWALTNEDPSDDDRARRVQARARRVLATLDWLADHLPTIGHGVRS